MYYHAQMVDRQRARDIAGQRFASLLAVRFVETRKRHAYWLFHCDCGTTLITSKSNVVRGVIRQCSICGHKQQARAVTKHGMSYRPEYQIYAAAKDRCENPNNPRFAQYGGRGIRFEFRDFPHFIAVLGFRPDPKLTLNRIDNDGPYAPANCEWTDWEHQFQNRRPWNWKKMRHA